MSKRSPKLEAKRSELIVLFLLMDSPRSGYQIRALIRDWQIARYLPVSPTTIYRTLVRLAGAGCIRGTARRNGRYPVSTTYAITTKGKRLYRQLIMAEVSFARTTYSLTTFIGLANYLTPAERERAAGAWQESALARVAELDARIKDRVVGPGHTYGKAFPEWMLFDHERDMMRAEAQWMDKYISFLPAHQPPI